jgi:hypothetical protein
MNKNTDKNNFDNLSGENQYVENHNAANLSLADAQHFLEQWNVTIIYPNESN